MAWYFSSHFNQLCFKINYLYIKKKFNKQCLGFFFVIFLCFTALILQSASLYVLCNQFHDLLWALHKTVDFLFQSRKMRLLIYHSSLLPPPPKKKNPPTTNSNPGNGIPEAYWVPAGFYSNWLYLKLTVSFVETIFLFSNTVFNH